MQFTTREQAEHAIASSTASFALTRRLPAYERHTILAHIAAGLGEQREDFAQLICDEAKKPIRDARVEVDRARLTFSLAADDAPFFPAEAHYSLRQLVK